MADESARSPAATGLQISDPADGAGAGNFRFPFAAVAFVLGIFGSLYVFLRALLVPFTFDEAFSYLYFIRGPVSVIISRGRSPSAFLTANDHFLNSLLTHFSFSAFGSSELALRLPNVLAFPFFLFFSWSLFRRVARRGIAFAGFLLLASNVFLLDFFSLCRGYGIALACLAAGAFWLLRGLDSDPVERADLVAAFLALALGASAFYGLLAVLWTSFLGAVGVAWVRSRRSKTRNWMFDVAGPALIVAGATAFLEPILANLRHRGELWYGGRNGFWRDTIGSLITVTIGDTSPGSRLQGVVSVVVVVLVVLVAMTALVAAVGGTDLPFLFVVYLLFAEFVIFELAHAASATPYPMDRTAILLVPLFWVSVAGGWETIAARAGRIGRRAVAAASGALAAASVALFLFRANVDRTVLWSFEVDTPVMLEDLARIQAALPSRPRPVSLGLDWRLVPTVEYYRLTKNLTWLQHVTQEDPWDSRNDFVFLLPHERGEVGGHGARVLRVYSRTGNVLAITRRRIGSNAGAGPNPGPHFARPDARSTAQAERDDGRRGS